ncbi:MAG: response regulator [Proteobacteria bacterium]|nr:response regulator [Pseudomonadota bacterium]NIS71680.1 response regulator [Pseudomonadota bacterium]
MAKKKTILIVDDDESQRFLCQETLAEEGYRVVAAKNGKEALAKVEQERPDLVILDIVMPQMDGMEAMTRIIRKHRKIPVILNTSYSRYREDFLTWAADAYVVKSPDFTELKDKIEKLLSKVPENKVLEQER